jgi:hypothetical protein
MGSGGVEVRGAARTEDGSGSEVFGGRSCIGIFSLLTNGLEVGMGAGGALVAAVGMGARGMPVATAGFSSRRSGFESGAGIGTSVDGSASEKCYR